MKRAFWAIATAAVLAMAQASAEPVFQPQAGKGWWAFDPPQDTFSPNAKLDLRSLNEGIAGQHGFVRLSPDGNSFVRGDGQPIRFWGGTVSAEASHADIDAHARFLAKRGVNMVRWHGHLAPINRPDSLLTDVNDEALDQLFYFVAAMKKQGIYVTVSPYYALTDRVFDDQGKRLFPNWTEPRDPKNATTMGLLFYDPVMQDAYKGWVRAMMTRVNPYTGQALKDDPAVAIFQIQNEDSLLFWTFNGLQGADRDLLEHQFGDWLATRYGSLAAAQDAWDHAQAAAAPSQDRPAQRMMALPNLAELGKAMDPDSGLGRRYRDSTEFLTRTMYDFNAGMVHFVKDDLGAQQLINAGNWRTASSTYLFDAERYSYTATDILAVNRYVTGVHEGSDTAGWAVAKGERFTSVSTIKDVAQFPLNLKQVDGHPMLVTESDWVAPNAYESEGPFLVSAMQSLTGVDGFYWFSLGDRPGWDQPKSANGYLPSIGKFTTGTPMLLGQFPAAALMYRRNDMAEASAPAVFEHRTPEDLWNRTKPLIEEEGGFDPNRDTVREGHDGADLSALSYLVGPVRMNFRAGDNRVADLSPNVDAKTATVTSLTGQMHWNYGKGVVTIDSPQAQGVSGFLHDGGGSYRLSDITIASSNAYATVTVVSLDGQALRTSHRLLIQVGTQARPTGWQDAAATWTSADGATATGRTIVEHGHAPWLVADTDAQVTITNPDLTRATALDGNFMAVAKVAVRRTKDGLIVDPPKDCLYVIVE